MPKLIYRDPETDQEMSLDVGDSLPEVTVGRNPGNVLRVNNPSISRRHAKIVWEGGQCTLYDLDSSNGSYINGNRVRSQVLQDGDRMRIGEFPLDFVDASDSATAEVSPEMIENVLSASGMQHRSTHLGGFQADPELTGEDLDIVAIDEVIDAPPEGGFAMGGPPTPPGGGVDFQLDMGADEGAFAMGAPEGGGFVMGGAPEDGGFAMGGGQEGGFAMGGGQEGGFAMGGGDPIELEPDPEPGGFSMGGGFSADHAMDAATSEAPAFGGQLGDAIDAVLGAELSGGSDPDDLDTNSASPEVVASSLAKLDRLGSPDLDNDIAIQPDMTVEESVESVAAILGENALQENRELIQRISELEAERDEILEAAAGGGNAASQLQIDRLRKERDRLSEERRSLMRQIAETKRALDDAPSATEFEAAQTELGALREAATQNSHELVESQQMVEARDGEIAEFQAQVAELKQALDDERNNLQGADALGDQLSDAQEVIQTAQGELKQVHANALELGEQLQAANTELENLDQMLSEREQELLILREEIEAASQQIEQRDAQLAEFEMELTNAHATIGAMSEDLEALSAELESRPVADEVIQIKNSLDKALSKVESLTQERDSLLDSRAALKREHEELRQTLDAVNVRYDKVGGEMEAIRRERDALKDERGAFARETDYLQSQRRKLQDEIKELKKDAKSDKKEAKRKNQIFGELSRDLRRLVGENNSLTDQVEELRAQVDGAPSADEVTTLRETVATFESETRTLQDRVDELEADASDLTRALGKYAEEKEAAAEEIDSLKAQNEALVKASEDTVELAGAMAALTESRDEALKALEAAQGQLAQLQAEMEDTRGSLDEMTQRFEDTAGEAKIAEIEAKLLASETALAEMILENDKLNDEIKNLK